MSNDGSNKIIKGLLEIDEDGNPVNVPEELKELLPRILQEIGKPKNYGEISEIFIHEAYRYLVEKDIILKERRDEKIAKVICEIARGVFVSDSDSGSGSSKKGQTHARRIGYLYGADNPVVGSLVGIELILKYFVKGDKNCLFEITDVEKIFQIKYKLSSLDCMLIDGSIIDVMTLPLIEIVRKYCLEEYKSNLEYLVTNSNRIIRSVLNDVTEGSETSYVRDVLTATKKYWTKEYLAHAKDSSSLPFFAPCSKKTSEDLANISEDMAKAICASLKNGLGLEGKKEYSDLLISTEARMAAAIFAVMSDGYVAPLLSLGARAGVYLGNNIKNLTTAALGSDENIKDWIACTAGRAIMRCSDKDTAHPIDEDHIKRNAEAIYEFLEGPEDKVEFADTDELLKEVFSMEGLLNNIAPELHLIAAARAEMVARIIGEPIKNFKEKQS